VPTFLADGQVAGTWRHEDGRVVVTPFEPLPADDMKAVRAEAERLEAFLGWFAGDRLQPRGRPAEVR